MQRQTESARQVPTMCGIGLGADPAMLAAGWDVAGSSIGIATTSGIGLQGLPWRGTTTIGFVDMRDSD